MQELIKLKYAEDQIKKLSDAELTTKAANSLRIIHVITGWNLPDDKEYMRTLLEQFTLKLKEDFGELNFQEISSAFRKNGLGIVDWGKSMNLDLICRVLGEFYDKRYEAGIMEEKAKPTAPPIIYTDDELYNFQRQWTEEFYQRLRRGINEPVPAYVSKILLKDEIIKDAKDTVEYIIWALNNNMENIYVKDDNG
ncbi:MAG: hypothetical protein ABIP68_02040 [Ferruginibacter sp.]